MIFPLSLYNKFIVLFTIFDFHVPVPYLQYLFGQTARANSVDSDETPQNAASHQDLHCLPLIHQFLDTT